MFVRELKSIKTTRKSFMRRKLLISAKQDFKENKSMMNIHLWLSVVHT